MRVHSQQSHRTEAINIIFRASISTNSRVVIGSGAIGDTDRFLKQCQIGRRVAVITQPALKEPLVDAMVSNLSLTGFDCQLIMVPDGEQCKTPETLIDVWTQLQRMNLQRADAIVAVGGGALTDLAGFAAATYLRGVGLVLVPTTLLAQVDAAIGGKTGINLHSGKNLAGSFYFPTAVIVDPMVLSTLPEREVNSGLGEIIKYALIEETVVSETDYRRGPRSLWSVLQELIAGESFAVDSAELQGIISACVKMKLAVVAKDPREGNLRRCLNLGHTLGHAVEKVSHYEYTHGEAVAIGLVFACRLAEKFSKWSEGETAKVVSLLQKAGLPFSTPGELDKSDLMQAMSFDKKREGKSIKWVLPIETIGSVTMDIDIASEQVQALL